MQVILRDPISNPDPHAIALSALAWILADPHRTGRLLALTGIEPAELRERLGDGAVLGAVLDSLLNHEPELLDAAADLGLDPATIASARAELAG